MFNSFTFFLAITSIDGNHIRLKNKKNVENKHGQTESISFMI